MTSPESFPVDEETLVSCWDTLAVAAALGTRIPLLPHTVVYVLSFTRNYDWTVNSDDEQLSFMGLYATEQGAWRAAVALLEQEVRAGFIDASDPHIGPVGCPLDSPDVNPKAIVSGFLSNSPAARTYRCKVSETEINTDDAMSFALEHVGQ